MNKSRPSVLVFVLLLTIAYAVSGIVLGLGSWIVKTLGLAAVIGYGVLLYIVWKNKEKRKKS
ncbi:hypothetical protein [Sporosarcina gallistercoris]|uniref:DUF5325 family protein n=1 Tax=Sporosarcina gallistercoris TaxID=2762245 RepID=A0ABR8PNA1_9BACL|nr:hypothetical protein [Sporosarcina gallistercoris]MBD7909664.1 hypothetical protein [Sporosarcina gallistercoris]